MTLITTLTIGFLALSFSSNACKCETPRSLEEAFKTSEVIVYGKIIRKDTVFLPETIRQEDVEKVRQGLKGSEEKLQLFERIPVLEVELEVTERFKGDVYSKSVIIYTPLLSGSCGFRFQQDSAYIVYASKRNFLSFLFENDPIVGPGKNNTFWTSACTWTKQYDRNEAEQLNVLKK